MISTCDCDKIWCILKLPVHLLDRTVNVPNDLWNHYKTKCTLRFFSTSIPQPIHLKGNSACQSWHRNFWREFGKQRQNMSILNVDSIPKIPSVIDFSRTFPQGEVGAEDLQVTSVCHGHLPPPMLPPEIPRSDTGNFLYVILPLINKRLYAEIQNHGLRKTFLPNASVEERYI